MSIFTSPEAFQFETVYVADSLYKLLLPQSAELQEDPKYPTLPHSFHDIL